MIDTSPKAPADLEELRQLACLVAGQPDLRLMEGPPGSGWSFSPALRQISMDGRWLKTHSRNFNRGLLLHETGHAAMTRLHDLIRGDYFRRPDVFGLLNAVEDCRLETFLATRFPGSRPWIREYNDILLKETIPDPGPLAAGQTPPLGHLVAALLATWWHGRDKVQVPESLRPWVDEAWPHLEAICRCLPQAATALPSTVARYQADDVSLVYAGADLIEAPSAWEMEVRMAQAAMWRIFEANILPLAKRLAPPGQFCRLPKELERLFERWLLDRHLGPGLGAVGLAPSPAGSMMLRPFRLHGKRADPAGGGAGSADEQPSWAPDPQAYAAAAHAQERAIEKLGATVLRILQPRTLRRWSGPHRSGTRLNLAGARRAESDARLQDHVWDRPGEPRRPDPLMVLLLDRSGSMEGAKIRATLHGAVLLTEVCHRLDVSLGIYTFAGRCERLLDCNRHANCI